MMHRLRRYDVFRFAQNDVAPLRSAMMGCLPQCAVRHTSLGVAAIIGEANIICRRQTSFKKRTFVGRQKCVFCWCGRREFAARDSALIELICLRKVMLGISALAIYRRRRYVHPIRAQAVVRTKTGCRTDVDDLEKVRSASGFSRSHAKKEIG